MIKEKMGYITPAKKIKTLISKYYSNQSKSESKKKPLGNPNIQFPLGRSYKIKVTLKGILLYLTSHPNIKIRNTKEIKHWKDSTK